MLSGPDLLLDLALVTYQASGDPYYASTQRFQRLTYYLDILLASRNLEPHEWEVLDRAVETSRQRDALGVSLTMTRHLLPRHLPDEAVQRSTSDDDALLTHIGRSNSKTRPVYVWRQSLAERMVAANLPDDFPRVRNPFPPDSRGAT